MRAVVIISLITLATSSWALEGSFEGEILVRLTHQNDFAKHSGDNEDRCKAKVEIEQLNLDALQITETLECEKDKQQKGFGTIAVDLVQETIAHDQMQESFKFKLRRFEEGKSLVLSHQSALGEIYFSYTVNEAGELIVGNRTKTSVMSAIPQVKKSFFGALKPLR